MNPASPAASVCIPGSHPSSPCPIASMAVPGPPSACAIAITDQTTKMMASPTFVPTRSMSEPTGICPTIMPG